MQIFQHQWYSSSDLSWSNCLSEKWIPKDLPMLLLPNSQWLSGGKWIMIYPAMVKRHWKLCDACISSLDLHCAENNISTIAKTRRTFMKTHITDQCHSWNILWKFRKCNNQSHKWFIKPLDYCIQFNATIYAFSY